MATTFQKEILQIIGASDGQLSWYQIDRAVSCKEIKMTENLMTILNVLVKKNSYILEKAKILLSHYIR